MAEALDCRGKGASEAGRAILARFNGASPGTRFEARVDAYAPALRVWLLEAGARHSAAQDPDGSWRLEIARGLAPAQGSVPGVHHVVSGADGSVWTCERAERVARIDGGAKRVVATARVARKASHIALHERADRLFVADSEGGEIIALRASDLKELQRWPAPGMPQLPLVSNDGVVCVTGGANGSLTIAWPHGDRYRSETFAVGECPHDPLLSAGGEYVYVPCAGGGEIVKLRLADGRIVGRVAVGDGPSHLALHPDGERVYSANSWDGTITCFTADGEPVATAPSGRWAHAIEVTPDGRWVYVANFLDDTLAVFDAGTLERRALLATDAYPHGLDVSPDGRYVVATGFQSDCLRVFDASSHAELARIEVGMGSSHTAFAPGSGAAYVGCSVSDHVACVDLAGLACTAQLRLS